MADVRVTQAGRQAATQEDADVRVTQAGRQAATQEDAQVRVTQAGRQAATQEDAQVRVTQAGRQAATQQTDADLRVTMLGRQVIILEPRPSRPLLITPVQDGVYNAVLIIAYNPSTDPLGGSIWYHFRYRKVGDSVWTDAFADRLESTPFVEDISALDDDDYEAEFWSSTLGYESIVTELEFVIHNGVPTAPVITAPYYGQEWQQEPNDVEWDPSVDPQGDPLTYLARYRVVGAGSWTSLFTDETSPYEWNMTGLAVNDYELEIWSNDGIGDSVHAFTEFSVGVLDRPSIPRIRITGYDQHSMDIELEAYNHPQSRPWQATQYQVIPWGGDWTNTTFDVTTTDSAYALLWQFDGMSPGFHGVVRARHQDDNDTWGPWSAELEFALPGATEDYERRWDRTGHWTMGGESEISAHNGIYGLASPPFKWPSAQEDDAIVIYDSDRLGSFIAKAWVQLAGCNCGWIGLDTELRTVGIGVFSGNADLDNQYGIYFGLWSGTTQALGSGIPGAMGGYIIIHIQWDDGRIWPWTHFSQNQGLGTKVIPLGGYYNAWGIPIGRWAHPRIPNPWYHLTVWVQRNIGNNTTRIRGRVIPFDDEGLMETVGVGEWHMDKTVAGLTPCGQPGMVFGQGGVAFPLPAETNFRLFEVTALRDENQPVVTTVDPLTPYSPDGPGACVVQTEDDLPDPMFFPAPPNGEVTEEVVYPSDVIVARDDTEQRVSLHDEPIRTIGWMSTLPTAREVTHLKSLVFGNQAARWGVPMWMDAAPLTVDLAGGAGSIPSTSVDVSGRGFGDVDYVAIWIDQFTWDFLPVTLEGDGSLTLTGTTSRAYAAHKTVVIPVRIGRMTDRLDFPRVAPYIADLTVEFVLEAIDG